MVDAENIENNASTQHLEAPVNVIYQTAEDGLGDTIKPRLLAAGADCTRIRKETECNGRSGAIQQVQNSTNRGRKRKVQAGIPGKEGNTGKLSLVEILADHFITGACHAPVNIRQGESR